MAFTSSSDAFRVLLIAVALGACGGSGVPSEPPVEPPVSFAERLSFSIQPINTSSGAPISVAVTLVDAAGNTVTSATDAVKMAIDVNSGGGTLSGATTVEAVNGVATFANISIDKAGTGYTLAASAGTLASVSTQPFTVLPGAASKLAFTIQPTPTDPNQQITPGVTVSIQDSFGNTVTSAATAVTVMIGTNPAGGTLSGATTVNAAAGEATFANLAIGVPGDGYTLKAVSGSLPSATSAAFRVYVPFAALTTGGSHTCGLTAVGVAYCWGANGSGQLGNGAMALYEWTPVAVAGNLTFASLSAGSLYTCGVTTGGTAYCWGSNGSGQLGDGAIANRTSPVLVSGGLSFGMVSAGLAHTCGVTTGRVAYCWGANSSGQLGDGTTTARRDPTLVSGALSMEMVSVGSRGGSSLFGHTCGVTTGGTAYCWGDNGVGQLGTGVEGNSLTPVRVYDGPFSLAFTSLSAGATYNTGVTTGNEAYFWGVSSAAPTLSGAQDCTGFLGAQCYTTPIGIFSQVSWVAMSAAIASNPHTCGVTTTGAAYCWGYNGSGQLGDGSTTSVTSGAVPVHSGLFDFATVSTGESHTCGLTTTGAALCWGANSSGQLGDGSTIDRLTPVRVGL